MHRKTNVYAFKYNITEECSHHSTSPLRHTFPNYAHYNKHTQVKTGLNSIVYHFVKYMDNTYDLNYTQKLELVGYGEPPCPNYTHRPKLFS